MMQGAGEILAAAYSMLCRVLFLRLGDLHLSGFSTQIYSTVPKLS